MHTKDSQTSADEAVRRWRDASQLLEQERLQRLKALTETEAAQLFAELLSLRGAYPLRQSSGLVEQQRILRRAFAGES